MFLRASRSSLRRRTRFLGYAQRSLIRENVSLAVVDRITDCAGYGVVDHVASDGILINGRTSDEADNVDVPADEVLAIGEDSLIDNDDAVVTLFVDDVVVVVVVVVLVAGVDVAIVRGIGWNTSDKAAVLDRVIFVHGSIDGHIFIVSSSLKALMGEDEGEETSLP
ncbi:hypothetical protein NDU88_002006 [Pleurodeles waltl]|uniref:Uncharacterized protein n=1 Tax=Pleurodeles waltl TaxID=8319 RepID=A0AAV7KSD3_PLEWA|nr:hypothetical protein NDU88_002006 [Pleurodeles waltl]